MKKNMSDNNIFVHSNPTTYKGIEMKSKMEARFAYCLDKLNISWEYEPTHFVLSDGTRYIPDFKIILKGEEFENKRELYVEVKGIITPGIIDKITEFCKENIKEILLISDNKSYFGDWSYGSWNGDGSFGIEENFMIGLCSHCKNYFICGYYGSYHCRHCGKHEGDHDIKMVIEEGLDNFETQTMK